MFCSEDSVCVHTVCLGKVTCSLEGQDGALLEDIKDLSGFSKKKPPQITLQIKSTSKFFFYFLIDPMVCFCSELFVTIENRICWEIFLCISTEEN